MNPPSQPSDVFRALFDGIATGIGYASLARHTGYRGGDWLKALLSREPHLRSILDLGCADGHLGRILRESGFDGRLVGVDFSPKMLEKCGQSGAYDACFLLDLNYAWLPPETPPFELAVAFGVTEFVARQEDLLSNVASSLTHGGRLWVTFEEGEPRSEPFKRLHGEESARTLVESAGFVVRSCVARNAYLTVHGLSEDSVQTGEYTRYVLVEADWP